MNKAEFYRDARTIFRDQWQGCVYSKPRPVRPDRCVPQCWPTSELT